jgi:hypothetical protein
MVEVADVGFNIHALLAIKAESVDFLPKSLLVDSKFLKIGPCI